MYTRDGVDVVIAVEHCPVCGFGEFRDKGSYVKCANCGSPQSVFGHAVAVGIKIGGAM